MSERSDIDHVLRHWFDDGPTTMPDRVPVVVADRIARERQRPAWRLPWRDSHVNTFLKPLAAIAAVIVIAVVGWTLLPGRSSGPGQPTTPTAPVDVARAWVNAVNRGDDQAAARFFAPDPTITEFGVDAPDVAAFHSRLDCDSTIHSQSIVGNTVQLIVILGGCPTAGEIVVERITVVDGRITALALVAPTRTTSIITPFAYSLPAGWSKTLDVTGAVNFEPGDGSGFIGIWPDWLIASQSSCSTDPEPGLGRSVDDLVSWLAAHPALIASARASASVGGLDGQVLDIRKRPAATGGCAMAVNLFTHQGTVGGPGSWQIYDDQRMRLWFLDAGDGHVVTISVQTDTAQQSFEALQERADPVIGSLVFE